nr:hypothetical protein [Morchella crassipes]
MHLSSVEDRRGRCRRPPQLLPISDREEEGGADCISPPLPTLGLRPRLANPPSPLGGPYGASMGSHGDPPSTAATQLLRSERGGAAPLLHPPPLRGGTLPPSSFCWGGRA